MKTALVSLNVSYIHKNLALRYLMVTKPDHHEAMIFEGLVKAPLNLSQQILDYQPDVVALSVYIFNLEASIDLIRALKQAKPALKIVAGGPEATHDPEPLWENGIDGIFRGEAELVFWPTLEGKQSQGYQSAPHVHAAILKADLSILESYPSPYFLPSDAPDMDKRYLYVETSRGCPYGCTYCMASLDRQLRLFSTAAMDRFFDQLSRSKVRQVKFLDRTFNVQKERALKLAQACLTMPEPMTFHVELVGDVLDEALKTLLMAQGKTRFRMEIGVQSLNPTTLEAVGRVSNLPKLLDLIDQFAKNGMIQHTDLIAGLPYEDLASFKRSYQGLIALKPHEIQVGILKLLHGSVLRQNADLYGYQAEPQAPYQISQSHWMNKDDIGEVEAVALATEKAYNSGRLKDELDLILTQEGKIAFDVMAQIGKSIQNLKHPYSVKQFYEAVYDGLERFIPKNQAKALVTRAYYRNSALCPPVLFPVSIPKTRLNQLREKLALGNEVKHLILADRLDGKPGLELWLYGTLKSTKTWLLLNENETIEEKVTYETLTGHPQP